MLRIQIEEYCDEQGKKPFSNWFNRLNAQAASKITIALYKLSLGNFSNIKRLPGGILEYKCHFGPGYRIYFGQDGEKLIILLCGGTKKLQSRDIRYAQQLWKNYKQSRKAVTLEN